MRLALLACCALLFATIAFADDNPEPSASPDAAIKRLADAVAGKKADAEAIEKQRKALVERLKREHARLVKSGQAKKAVEVQNRLLLAETLKHGQALDTKLSVPKLLDKASSDGRYRELLHVLYLPSDKVSYKEFTDYGMSNTQTYGGQANLSAGYWVYVYPRWYVWKELKK